MQRILYQLSLKKRLLAALVLLAIICTSVTGLMSVYLASRVTEENAVELSRNTLNKSAQVLDERLKSMVVASSAIMISEPFRQVMKDVASGTIEGYYQNLTALQVPFAQMKLTETSIDSVLIVTPVGEFYPTQAVRNTRVRLQDTELFDLFEEGSPAIWVESHTDELFAGGARVISLLMQPYVESSSAGVYLIINIREEAVRELMLQNISDPRIGFMLLNGKGEQAVRFMDEEASAADRQALMEHIPGSASGYLGLGKGKSELLVHYARLRLAEDWTLVSLQSKEALLGPMAAIKWLVMAIMAVCIVLALFMSTWLADRLLRPLYRLQGLMHKVEQSDALDVRFESPYEDEVGRVGHSFNRMLARLDELIVEVKLTEEEKRKSEMKVLQAQIDPHFLYNTLNTILWKSETAEHQDVREMIFSLSQLFQLGLNNGRELTILEKELEHVRQYLKIQQKCYEGLFTFVIELKNPLLLRRPVVKILLQPLVENSILHGFKDMEQGGFIYIGIDGDDQELRLVVEDNGSGMDAAEVTRQMNSDHAERSSYALSNVYGRLALYYGAGARIELQSKPGIRTAVTLTLPAAELAEPGR
ncbi:cache domain-containing sensor histidine kinase [Paenibacillus puerhi]|uniref:cache domain-containing sensor histidine kinase n=1 Tax=Paenibacillus puerhi TaxID=2692622 RepID=UPI00135CBD11|nr:sensor histidine kinase [Paenibacillus puerhi]